MLRVGDELGPIESAGRRVLLRQLKQIYPEYRFKLRLPRDRCRASGVFRVFVPIVVGKRWRCPDEE